jgi:hypothetical protein
VGATPGEITTYDIVRQYDGSGDLPTNPLNLLSGANAALGFILVHTDYFSVDMSQAISQGTYGDTQYYLIPTYPLPILMPLTLIPLVGQLIADTLDPLLRVMVEAGYDRTINPGVPTPSNFLYSPEPEVLSENLRVAFLTGLDNGFDDLGMGRPLGTVEPGPYGVGGPPVTVATEAAVADVVTELPSAATTFAMPTSTDSTDDTAPHPTEASADQTVANTTDTTTHLSTTPTGSTGGESTPTPAQPIPTSTPSSTPAATESRQLTTREPMRVNQPGITNLVRVFGRPPAKPTDPGHTGAGTAASTGTPSEPSTSSTSSTDNSSSDASSSNQ